MSDDRIFPVLREKAPVIDMIRERTGIGKGKTVSSQSELAEQFRSGIAEGLGIPTEALNIEEIQQWIVKYTKAFISPDLMTKIAPAVGEIHALGKTLGSLIRNAMVAPSTPAPKSSENVPGSEPPARRKFDAAVSMGDRKT